MGECALKGSPWSNPRPTAHLGGERYTTSITFLLVRIPALRCTMESPGGSLDTGGHFSQYHGVQLSVGKPGPGCSRQQCAPSEETGNPKNVGKPSVGLLPVNMEELPGD